MRQKITILFLLTTIFINIYGQDLSNFKVDFVAALDKSFDEKQINNLFRKYSTILAPQNDVIQLMAGIKGEYLTQFPLNDFKNEKLYKENIEKLLKSDNSYHRVLSYLIIGASNDLSKEQILLKRLEEENEKGNLIWCGMALLNMKTKHTTEMFDFLVKNEDFGDAHMLPLFIRLDKDSLRETAYKRCNSEDLTTKILAIQILAETGNNPKTEKIVLDAVNNWDFNVKGYAIYTVKELQMGNLLETFKPLLENDYTKQIALQALANSPTKEDTDFLINLANQQDSISEDLLDCFFHSKNIENLKIWLQFLVSKKIPEDYYFSVQSNEIMYSDELLADIHNILKQIENEKVTERLLGALQGRTDDESTNILINFLTHENETIRYWSAKTLEGNKSEKLKQSLPALMQDEENRTAAIIDLLIENKIDNLQPLFENIYNENGVKSDFGRRAIGYLSSFPLDKHKEMFKSILKNKDADFFTKKDAALGLGRLKDITAVDLIIEEIEKTRKESDFNVRSYLVALWMIKGKKAKKEIETFLNSDEQMVSELAKAIIKHWNEK